MNELLKVERIKKKYGSHHAVKGVSFCVNKKETLGIVGESGSGKTTVARLILRLIEPTGGKVFFCDQELFSLSSKEMKKVRREIQVVFQNPAASLNPRKTIFDTLSEAPLLHSLCTEQDAIPYVQTLLDDVGLARDLLSRYPHELSLGQQQRISIARALSVQPSLLILDECVSSLDISVQAQILNLLQDLKERHQMTYLFISHDLYVVEHLADKVIVMKEGEIVEEGSTEEVMQKASHPYTQKLLSSKL